MSHRRSATYDDLVLEDPLLMNNNNPSRILDRDADFFQSRGRWSGVELLPRQSGRRNRSSLSRRGQYHYSSRQRQQQSQYCASCTWQACQRRLRLYFPTLWDDWFHTLAYQRTIVLTLILFCIYTGIVVAFGFVYLGVSILGAKKTQQPDGSFVTNSFCDMDINDHMEALYFSLSTMTTIGYGVSDYYFGGCWTPLLLVLMQVCTAITFDACAVGLLFTRLSRGRKRSKTIVVSNQAVVQVVQGVPYFMLRVGELRRVPLIEASVRLFCIRHERTPKLNHPSSSGYFDLASAATMSNNSSAIGGASNTNNALDSAAAPFMASSKGDSSASLSTTRTSNKTKMPNFNSTRTTAATLSQPAPSPATRRIPIDTTCFVTRSMKLLHPDEILMSLPQVIVHKMDETSPLVPPSEWYDAQGRQHFFPQQQRSSMNDNSDNDNHLYDVQTDIKEFWKDRAIEIVVLVEGTDELTGVAIQTRHSYCAGDETTLRIDHHTEDDAGSEVAEEEGDVVWNRAFVNCIHPYNEYEDEERGGAFRRRRYSSSSHNHHHPVCTVDFSQFHDVVPTPRDCVASPYVP